MIVNHAKKYQEKRKSYWDGVAQASIEKYPGSQIYLGLLVKLYQQIIPPGMRIVELGCGQGDLLASLSPSFGVGIDFSRNMVHFAKTKHPECHFICCDLHEIRLKGSFDVIILSDTLNDVWDIQRILTNLHDACHSKTVIITNFFSRVWEIPLKLTRWLKLSRPNLPQNWLTPYDVRNLFDLAGFDCSQHCREILLPINVPILSEFLNRTLSPLWPFRYINLTNIMTFSLSQQEMPQVSGHQKVSIIVPIRNEAGNIPTLIKRIPRMGSATELIIIEGHSTDQSDHVIKTEIKKRPDLNCCIIQQPATGKADAVFYGLDHASGDILMLLDGDLSFDPELLQRFYQALVEKRGEFIYGVRLVYPIEDEAMPFFNLLGNKIFGWIFSCLLGQPIRDTLCGTKVFTKADYIQIRAILGDAITVDPFGDFSLIFGAARLDLSICEIPIRYHKRLYGKSKTRPWQDGLLLVRVLIKFLFSRHSPSGDSRR